MAGIYVCVTVQFSSVGDSDTQLCEIYTINLMLARANARLHCQLSVSRVYYDVNMYACHGWNTDELFKHACTCVSVNCSQIELCGLMFTLRVYFMSVALSALLSCAPALCLLS